ncbi:MAG: restriction endonuclease subunit S [Lactobacillus crispatus]|jgi:type I restriction enzyme S subunit|nr:restriction endonuclease subunit S [Lactobacillus crispatus]
MDRYVRPMKDSGIEWIGKIPQNWLTSKIKFYLYRREPRNPGNMPVLSVYRDYGVVPKDSRNDNHNVTSYDTSNYKYVTIGDLVINKMKAWQGSLAVSAYTGIVSPAYYVYHFKNTSLNRKYFHYLIRNCYKDEFKRLSTGIRDGQWDLQSYDFENTTILIPPLKEQQLIIEFLDKKCGQIDKLLVRINDEIERLKVYRNSLIIRTVIRGLNPNVPMKDSGIEWVGSIPESWGVVPLYKLFNERKNKNIAGREQNLLSLSYGKIKRRDINAKGGLLPANFNTYNIVEDGDIIIRPTDLQNDQHSLRTGLVKEHGIITSAYIDLAPLPNTNSAYYHYLLHSYDIEKVFYNMGNGVRQGLNYSEFSKLKVLVPRDREMSNIVNYLDQKNSKLDSLVEKKQQQLNLLKEYKNSLIYEYVTGKKQVPKM